MSNKYKPGTKVSHSVYGDGTVTDVTEMGKHWSIKVDFEEGPRTVLSTFLTLKDVSEVIDHVMFPESSTVLVIPYATVPFQVFEPGTKVSHAIFGIGEVKDSKPKGKHYKLDIDFENGTSKTLLSTFIEIVSDDSTEEDADGGNEVVEAEVLVEADSSMEKLEKLIERRNAGEVTSEEFEEMKKEILERKPEYSKETAEIAQEEVHDTVVKESVVNKSNIGAGGKSKAEKLREVKALLDDGIIDDDDYEKMKREIIG
jgi:hypothetical protein